MFSEIVADLKIHRRCVRYANRLECFTAETKDKLCSNGNERKIITWNIPDYHQAVLLSVGKINILQDQGLRADKSILNIGIMIYS